MWEHDAGVAKGSTGAGHVGMIMSARILIVEDDEPLTLLLRYNLEAAGYTVDCAARGDEAELKLRETMPDLVVLDWMLPGISGIEICRRLRAGPATSKLPIVMLTARGEESERIRGLATGADDYVVKPFSVPELLARIGALLRRAKPERVAAVLSAGDVELDRERRRVFRAGCEIVLGPTEFRLLEHLLQARDACSRASSCWTVSGEMMSTSRTAPSMFMSDACARR